MKKQMLLSAGSLSIASKMRRAFLGGARARARIHEHNYNKYISKSTRAHVNHRSTAASVVCMFGQRPRCRYFD
jgi:hypothetical protein